MTNHVIIFIFCRFTIYSSSNTSHSQHFNDNRRVYRTKHVITSIRAWVIWLDDAFCLENVVGAFTAVEYNKTMANAIPVGLPTLHALLRRQISDLTRIMENVYVRRANKKIIILQMPYGNSSKKMYENWLKSI